jgi:hypothetical protein
LGRQIAYEHCRLATDLADRDRSVCHRLLDWGGSRGMEASGHGGFEENNKLYFPSLPDSQSSTLPSSHTPYISLFKANCGLPNESQQ